MKKRSSLRMILILLVILALTAGAAACGQAQPAFPPQTSESIRSAAAQPEGAQSAAAQPEGAPGPDAVLDRQAALAAATAQNVDTAAWLYLPGTEIDDPVMQAGDNSYYLRRNHLGEHDIWGCYFADCLAVLSEREALCTNTVIYGHSYSNEDPNERKFTRLFRYLDKDFLAQNQFVTLTLPKEELTFQIAAVFFTDTGFDYIAPSPAGKEWTDFLNTVAAKNEFVFEGAALSETDKLLTLSACAYRYDAKKAGDQRLVVMARLLPAGAEKTACTIAAAANPTRPG